jgi:hypothetical protein
MERAELHRAKYEVSDLLDRGKSLKEKYGGDYGWKLGLRYNEDRPGEVLEFRESVGGAFSGLSCLIKDDRWKPVEIIRKNDILEESRNSLIDKRFSLQDHSAKKNTERVGDY